MIGLTKTQKKMWDAIVRHWNIRGSAPSYSQLARATGKKSRSWAYRTVASLVERKVVILTPSVMPVFYVRTTRDGEAQ